MSSADSCGCTWQPAGQQPAAIPATQLSVPNLSQQYVNVRVSAGNYFFIVSICSIHVLQVEFARATVSWKLTSHSLSKFPLI
jgi:hypothetical protein